MKHQYDLSELEYVSTPITPSTPDKKSIMWEPVSISMSYNRSFHKPFSITHILFNIWRSGNGVRRINEVTLRRARLVLGWVTVFGRTYNLGM